MDLKYCAAFYHYNKWNKKGEYHHLRKVKIDDVLSHEFLDMAKDRLPFNRNRYCRRKFMKAYGLYHAQGMKHENHKFYAYCLQF